jgi:hypothetical protein
MSVVESVNTIETVRSRDTRRNVRMWCRIVVVVLVACQLWVNRFSIDADGTAYVDVARAWLRGDWVHALNAYWSPLYVWVLAAVLRIFSPSMHWELPALHIASFFSFCLSLAAWEWLIAEWELWQGPSANPMLTDVTGYCVILWAGLRMPQLGWLQNGDCLVLALLLAATALMVRVRRGAAANRDFVVLGLLLGTGYLAKTAFTALIPVFLVILALLLRRWTDRRILTVAVVAGAMIAPFATALSLAHGRFTLGDSGKINYSWQVTGISVEGYKENAYWPGPEIKHPIHVLLNDPRVLSYEQHLVGTLPVHFDAAWWCEGYPVRFNKARQLMILWSNIKFSIYAFRCPAIYLILFCLPFGLGAMMRRFAQTWFIVIPALFFVLTYCFVYSDYRYYAAPYAVIGFVLIAATWDVRVPRRIAWVAVCAIPLVTAWVSMGGTFRYLGPDLFDEVRGVKFPDGYTNVLTAEALREAGLQPGDRVAYIGFTLGAANVGLERAHIVAVVPDRITHDDKMMGRPLVFSFPRPHDFWARSREDQERVFQAFRSVGAKWVIADTVPKWADTSGWQVAAYMDHGTYQVRPFDKRHVYFKKLQ